MKVLSVRRGFTTNSSASSEWLPPQPGATPSETSSATHPESVPVLPIPAPPKSPWLDGARLGGLIGMIALVFSIDRIFRSRRKKNLSDRGGDDA